MGLFLKHQSIKDLVDLLEENLEKLDQADLKLAQEGQGLVRKKGASRQKDRPMKKKKKKDPGFGQKIQEKRQEDLRTNPGDKGAQEEFLDLEDLPYWARGMVYQTIFERPRPRNKYRHPRR